MTQWLNNLNDRGRVVVFALFVLLLIGGVGWVWTSDPQSATEDSPAVTENDGTVISQAPTTEPGTPETPDMPTSDSEPDDPGQPGELHLDLSMPVSEQDLAALSRKAAQFTAIYQSYRYDEDPTGRLARARTLLARDTLVDLSALQPSPSTQALLRTSKTVITVTPQRVAAYLVSTDTVGLRITATVTTSTDGETSRDQQVFAVTMAPSAGGWGVSDFLIPGQE